MKVRIAITMEHGTYTAEAESEVGDTEADCLESLLEQASYGAIAAAGFSHTLAREILGCPLCDGKDSEP